VLIALSAAGIVRILAVFEPMQTVSYLILLFLIVRNLYFLMMALFLADGRDDDGEAVRVTDAEPVTVRADGITYDGVTTLLTEHNLTVFLDEGQSLGLGKAVEITVWRGDEEVTVRGVVTGIREARTSEARTHTVEILDFGGAQEEYWQLLYDRIPTLPQSLQRDFGVLSHLWQNIAHRVARTRK
jgi:cellulose synthase (UDP-forming)